MTASGYSERRRPGGRLSAADERLALRSVGLGPKSGRRYRCDTCGVLYPVEDLHPELDEAGRRVGWACDDCM